MTILEKYENWGFLDNVQENKNFKRKRRVG
jgi:hypothetical protein